MPFDGEMKCIPGYEPCIGFADSWNLLGSIQYEDTMDDRRLVSSASGCAFLSADDIVFANTGYRNLLRFRFDNRTHVKRWNFTDVIAADCEVSGMQRVPQTSTVLYTCVDSGQVLKLSFNGSSITREVAASGIEFGPLSQAAKTNYPGLPAEDTTIKQCATASRKMMADVAMTNRMAYVINRNWNHLLKIDLDQACPLLPNSSVPNPLPSSIHCPAYLDTLGNSNAGCCCPECFNISCCRWSVYRRSSDFHYPRGISISDSQELALLSSDPFSEILLSQLSTSSTSSVLSGLEDVVAIRHAKQHDGLLYLTSSSELGFLPRRAGLLSAQIKSTFRIQARNARAMCLSEDGEKVGVAADDRVGVIGNEVCNLLTGCKRCNETLPQNASFVSECLWRCVKTTGFVEVNFTCSECAEGSVTDYQENPRGRCRTCEPGTYANTSLQQCISCPSGKFSELAGQTSCDRCPAGTYSETFGASNASSCLACSTGKASSVQGADSASLCIECLAGYFASSEGQTSCLPCALNTYSNDTGFELCLNCSLGLFANSTGSTTCSA